MNFHPWSDLSLPDSEYLRNYELLKENQIRVSDLGTGIRMNGYDKEGLKELERCSQIANIMPVSYTHLILVFPGRHSAVLFNKPAKSINILDSYHGGNFGYFSIGLILDQLFCFLASEGGQVFFEVTVHNIFKHQAHIIGR